MGDLTETLRARARCDLVKLRIAGHHPHWAEFLLGPDRAGRTDG